LFYLPTTNNHLKGLESEIVLPTTSTNNHLKELESEIVLSAIECRRTLLAFNFSNY